MNFKNTATICCILGFSLCAHAQKWEFGASLGATGYLGDLNTSDVLYYKNAGGGIFSKYNFNSTWGIRGNLNYLKISADDRDASRIAQQQRNLSFKSNLYEVSVAGEFNFFNFNPTKSAAAYTPYVFAGVGFAHFDPYTTWNNETYHLKEWNLEMNKDNSIAKKQQLGIIIPVGAGFKYRINGPWSVAAEVSYRALLSDDLDNTGKYYGDDRLIASQDKATWIALADPSGQIEQNRGKLRGDGRPFDGYMTAGFTVTYTLFSTNCFWWK